MKLSFETGLKELTRKMIRPVVSLLIKNSVSYRMLCGVLKEVYVDVAASEYGKGGRPTNVSRIALLTGLDRKEIKRLRDAAATAKPDTGLLKSGPLGRLLSAWHQDPDYSTNGKPNPLSIDDRFGALCKQYGGDITQTAILNELIRVGAVIERGDNKVIAMSRYYMPEQADSEAVSRSLDVYRDVGNTLLHNLYRPAKSPSRFEGRASSARISINHLDEFRAFVEDRGQQFLEVIDERLAELEKHNDPHQELIRLGMGIYWIENDQEPSQ